MLNKIKKVMFNPSGFFSKLKEKSLKKAFIYLAFIAAVYAVLYAVMSIIFVNLLGGITGPFQYIYPAFYAVGAWLIIVMGAVSYGITLGLSFLWGAILHVWLLIWGIKSDYEKTYQLYVYGNTPSIVLGWIPFANFVVWIWSMILLIIGTMGLYGTSKKKATWIYLLPILIMAVLIGLGIFFFFTTISYLEGASYTTQMMQ